MNSVTQIGLPPEQVLALLKLTDLFGRTDWRNECEFISNYMPPYPRPETRPAFVVYYRKFDSFLRHSCGPKQGFFWDGYGDDMQNASLALLGLLQADAPKEKPYLEFTIPLGYPVVPAPGPLKEER